MPNLTLITNVLEEAVKRELRQRGIVIWLDKDGHYTAYVDQLADRYSKGEFFAPVVAFRGSYLEMLLALESYGNGLDQEPLLIHMPGHTEESIRKTPLLELYRAGYRYRRALDALIREAATGRVSPSELESYLSSRSIDLAAAETWLQQAIAQPQDGLAAYLESLNLEWILDGILGTDSILRSKIADAPALLTLKDHLHRHTGISDEFIQLFYGTTALAVQDLAEAFAAWLMCVEYVNDLTRLPHLEDLKPLRQLSTVLQKTCSQLIHHFRQRYPDTYESMAAIVESRLEQELQAIRPEDLGKIDTFQCEETAVLEAAVQALLQAKWTQALTWAESRTTQPSFWIERNKTGRLEWLLIHDAATLGCAIEQAASPLRSCQSLRQALDYYTQSGYQVDRAHRHFEQQRLKLLEPTLTHYASLQEAGNWLQVQYRHWADQLAQDFAAICASEGFLPESDLQQRTLYDQVVHPLTQANRKVAYFLIDAFRFEMATELLSELEAPGTTVVLKGRYAELPSITAVGMNALTPVSKAGRLTLAGSDGFKGFRAGEYAVRSPDERFRAMSEKSIDSLGTGRKRARAIKLSEVRSRTIESLKKGGLSDADLVVVHSQEIDDAGEANVGLATFETWLQHLKTAWSRLKSLGFNEFVFTADHGFLLQDQTTQSKPYGSKRDPDRRHVLMTEPRSEAGTITVSLSALQYDGQEGYLLFRRDTANFATGNPGATFVHGGNSLQERVIPVLIVSHRHASEPIKLKYLAEVKAERELLGHSRLRLRVKPAPDVQLSFIGARTIGLALRVPNRPDIQLTIKDAPGIEVKNQVLLVPVEGDWIEILFDLKGIQGERVPVEIYHPEGTEEVEPTATMELFSVSGTLQPTAQTATPQAGSSLEWHNRFEDEGVCQVFLHLQQHGSITEIELTQMLGNARKVRRFSMDFEEHLKQVPFSVRIETTPSGKRYVRQN
ncbi:MAG: BREX-6 system phosphatase PglZ [Elainella sp.]